MLIPAGHDNAADAQSAHHQAHHPTAPEKQVALISGGYNIYPKELEDVLLSKEGILEAAVVGVEDRDKGEVPKAVARYKQPKYAEIVTSLPKTSAGKVKKFMLK